MIKKMDNRRIPFFLFLLLAYLLFLPVSSGAHAFPDHSDPRVGSAVASPPTSVRIWFDSDLEPIFSRIIVKNSSGKQVDKGDSHVAPSNDALLIVDLPPLSPGTYHVYWNVVARDTHRTEGDFTFTVK